MAFPCASTGTSVSLRSLCTESKGLGHVGFISGFRIYTCTQDCIWKMSSLADDLHIFMLSYLKNTPMGLHEILAFGWVFVGVWVRELLLNLLLENLGACWIVLLPGCGAEVLSSATSLTEMATFCEYLLSSMTKARWVIAATYTIELS